VEFEEIGVADCELDRAAFGLSGLDFLTARFSFPSDSLFRFVPAASEPALGGASTLLYLDLRLSGVLSELNPPSRKTFSQACSP